MFDQKINVSLTLNSRPYIFWSLIDIFDNMNLQGLSHLHTEIFGTKGKPAIAHRFKQKQKITNNPIICFAISFMIILMKASPS